MAVHRGSSNPKIAPTVVPQAATNVNQERATFSAYVTANKYDTTVYFDYSTSPTFSSYSTVTHWVTVTAGPYFAYYNVSGLTPNTTYYYRCRAVNAIGTTIGQAFQFLTWSLKTFLSTTSGAYSVSVPSITPYLDSPIAPTIYEMLIYGAGGGANYGGGGGGGYRIASSKLSSTAGTQNVTGSIGAGGAGGNGGTGTGSATSGGSTTLTIGNTTYTAGGGTAGNHPGNCGSPFGRGGTAGTGDNASNLGGTNTYGYLYYYQCNPYCCEFDKNNNCTQTCYQTCSAYDCGYYACGGGGGTDGAGTNAYTQNTTSHNGGTGGAGGGAYGLNGGNGGGGYGTQSTGAAGSRVAGGTAAGTGGTSFAAGLNGGVTFKYYGP